MPRGGVPSTEADPKRDPGPACSRSAADDGAAGPAPAKELYKAGEVAARRRNVAGADDTAGSGSPGSAARPDVCGPCRGQGSGGRRAMRSGPGGLSRAGLCSGGRLRPGDHV